MRNTVDHRPRLQGAAATWAGRLAFTDAHALNLEHAAAAAQDGEPRLLLFEPVAAVLTLGRRVWQRGDLADTIAAAEAAGIPTVRADRGGQATLHLPGQLVVFVAVACDRTAIAGLVDELLDAARTIATAHGVQVTAGTGVDTGLWVGGAKLASVGLRHADGVARHGLAMNVAIDAELTPHLTLCGHRGAGYVDLAQPAQRPAVADVAKALCGAWSVRWTDDREPTPAHDRTRTG